MNVGKTSLDQEWESVPLDTQYVTEQHAGRRGSEGVGAAHLTIHWHERQPLKLTNSERKLQFCAFVSICMSKGNWEIVLQCQVLLAVFSLW